MPTIDWQDSWDEAVGMWRQEGGGHSPLVKELSPVHSGRTAAARLLFAAELGQLSRIDVPAVLRALSRLQMESGSYEGCFKWYWEEREPYDTNGAFFIGLPLLVLWKCYRAELDAASRSLLEAVFRRLDVWFSKAVGNREFFAPNGFLGELVCTWFLAEVLDTHDAGPVEDVMFHAADYLLENEWGWGEHLSDGYSTVCLDQLSVLLLLSERLPLRLRRKYAQLFHELLDIEDRFDGGPRVPALRSYAGSTSPTHRNYREKIRPAAELTEETARAALDRYVCFDPLLYDLGWHRLAGARIMAARDVHVRCFGGATATARLEHDIRVGSLSRFPLMPSAEHPQWGLSWQCFPVAFWRPEGDWGFLQWETEEEGRIRSHPAVDYGSAYLDNALTLKVLPPVVGRTFAIQRSGSVLALRIMAPLPSSWARLTDRLRIVQGHAALSGSREESWSQLLLEYPERTLSVVCLPLTAPSVPTLALRDGSADWELSYTRQTLSSTDMVVTLWGISTDHKVVHAPTLSEDPGTRLVPRQAEQRAWRLHWVWPGTTWNVRIDPLLESPLVHET